MRKMYYLMLTLTILLLSSVSVGAQVVITDKPSETINSANTILKVSTGNDKGLLLPYVNTAQRDALTVRGLMVYNTDTKAVEFLTGIGWRTLTAAGSPKIAGTNNGTDILDGSLPEVKIGDGGSTSNALLQLESGVHALVLPVVTSRPTASTTINGLICINNNKLNFVANGAWQMSN